MLAKLIAEGKEFDIEILDPKLQELLEPKKKTGYERVEKNKCYCIVNDGSTVTFLEECGDNEDDEFYDFANYYESEFVAAQNARADTLMRKLRRFAVEHRVNKINWGNNAQAKWFISYDHHNNSLIVNKCNAIHSHGITYFDRIDDADEAIEVFRDELIWYFTEYRDSL